MITPSDFVRKFEASIEPPAAYDIARFAMRELETTSDVKLATAFLAGVLLHVARSAEMPDKSLRGVANYLNDPERSITDTITSLLTYPHDPEYKQNWITPGGKRTKTMPQIAFVARMMLDLAEWQRYHIYAIAISPLLHDIFIEKLYPYEVKEPQPPG